MKQKVLDMLGSLHQFADELVALYKHPYSKGVDIEKAIGDLKNFIDNFANTFDEEKEPAENEETEE
jgi:hypothetical protein